MNPKWESIYRQRHDVEKHYEWDKWRTEIPYLSFPAGWQVRIIPPMGGAIIRFIVRRDNASESVSVYFDAYGELGAMDKPYWEIYPDHTGDCSRFWMDETDELIEAIGTSLDNMGGMSS